MLQEYEDLFFGRNTTWTTIDNGIEHHIDFIAGVVILTYQPIKIIKKKPMNFKS